MLAYKLDKRGEDKCTKYALFESHQPTYIFYRVPHFLFSKPQPSDHLKE